MVRYPRSDTHSSDALNSLFLTFEPIIARTAYAIGLRHHLGDNTLMTMDDAIQVGYFGLKKAVETWKDDGRASFETYARLKIRFAILDALRGSRRGRYLPTLRLDDEEMPEPVEWTTAEDQAHVERVLEGLDTDTRDFQALYEWRVQGDDLETVGRRWGLTFTRIWQLARRAELALRRALS